MRANPLTPALLLVPVMVACSSGTKAVKSVSRGSSSWTCPDSGLIRITESNPSDTTSKPWVPPTSPPKATSTALPALYINFLGPGTGDELGNKEFTEPYLPWIGDLNGDGRMDFILRDGIGDSKETAVLVGCGTHFYQPVFMGSADEISVEKDTNREAVWKLLSFRYVLAGSYDYEVIVRRWDGKEYKPCNQYRTPIDAPKLRTNGCSQ